MSESAPFVVESVAKSYGDPPLARAVVQDCSFVARAGELTVLIGPSGCGKSTLVRVLAGYEPADRGRVLLHGRPVRRARPELMVVFQESALFPWMSAKDNVTFGPLARGEPRAAAASRADELLRRVGIARFARRYPAQLSGGMRRRAELARALASDPEVMILDEPFRGLDALTRSLMVDYYAELAQSVPAAHVFVTTDVDEAVALADRLYVMSGRPMRVVAELPVRGPRPRRAAEFAAGGEIARVRTHVAELLRKEVLATFARAA